MKYTHPQNIIDPIRANKEKLASSDWYKFKQRSNYLEEKKECRDCIVILFHSDSFLLKSPFMWLLEK